MLIKSNSSLPYWKLVYSTKKIEMLKKHISSHDFKTVTDRMRSCHGVIIAWFLCNTVGSHAQSKYGIWSRLNLQNRQTAFRVCKVLWSRRYFPCELKHRHKVGNSWWWPKLYSVNLSLSFSKPFYRSFFLLSPNNVNVWQVNWDI